jgi:hypothetical protein
MPCWVRISSDRDLSGAIGHASVMKSTMINDDGEPGKGHSALATRGTTVTAHIPSRTTFLIFDLVVRVDSAGRDGLQRAVSCLCCSQITRRFVAETVRVAEGPTPSDQL